MNDNVGRTLLDRIVSSPDDDELRLVYADWLLERGDLRGELIQLQLRPSLTRAETDRVVTLREAHESRWLGPVARVTRASDRIWVRGFLVEATIESRKKQDLRAAMEHEAWALVRTIRAGGSAAGSSMARPLVELLSGGALRSLRSIKDANADTARGLLHTSADNNAMQAIDALEIVLHRREDTELAEEALAGPGLPNLRELTFSGWIRETRELSLIDTNVGRRIEVVTLLSRPQQLREWISRVTNVPSFGPKLRVVKLRWLGPGQEYRRTNHWTLTLKRDDDEAWSILEVHGAADEARSYARPLAAVIAGLPRETLSRFAMYLTGETRFTLMYFSEIERAIGTQERLTDATVTVPYDRAIARVRYDDDY